MTLLLLSLSAFASPSLPDVHVAWKGPRATLAVTAPAGEHLAPDAPADLDLSWGGEWLSMSASGADLADGVPIRDLRGAHVLGTLRMSLCEDGGSLCRMVDVSVEVDVPDSKKGRVGAAVSVAQAPASHQGSPFRVDADAVYREAAKAAARDETLLLLDFSAVWCPPCNLMSAEVLHSSDPPAVLDRYEVAVLDVDDRTSWTLKDAYQVGGYPTVIVARPDGTEITRTVGYTDASSFVRWLETASVRQQSDDELAALAPADVEPQRAAEIAWLLARKDPKGDVEPWLERAAPASDVPDFRMARVVHQPNVDDVRWLALHAPERALEWIWNVDGLDESDEGREALTFAVQRALSDARGPIAAELLYLAASISQSDDGPLLFGAAASALRTALTGDPVVDRGHYTFLAKLQSKSGDLEGGLALLQQASQTFPDEPTFHLSASGLLLAADRPSEALTHADLAYERAWGDNRLRCAIARADALIALGRHGEARSYVQQQLDATVVPDPDTHVRTHRYIGQLRERLDADG